MKDVHRFKVFLALALSFGLTLGGCGGGGGSSSSDTAAVNPSAISGTVADGYLEDAMVCLDYDLDGLCTEADPYVMSTTNGAYTIPADVLKAFGIADPSLYPIIVKTIPGTTRDLDTGILDKEVVLKAPAGKPEFVSPITTMVQKKIETAKAAGVTKTPDEAAEDVKGDLQMDVNPFDNYVAKKADDTLDQASKEMFDKVHMVAQAVTRTMATMQETFKTTASPDIDLDVIINAVVEKVMEQLPAILADVDYSRSDAGGNKTSADYDTSTVVNDVSNSVDPTEVQAALDKAKAEAEVVKSSFQNVLVNGGSYWLDAWINYDQVNFEYSVITYANDVLNESDFEYANGDWQPVAENGNDLEYILTANGWVEYADGPEHYDVVFNADGTATITHKTLGFVETISVTEFALAGKRHMGFAGHAAKFLQDPTATFSDGAKAFKLVFTPHQDVYRFSSWLDDQTGVDWNYVRFHDETGQENIVVTIDDMLSVFAEGTTGTYYLPVGNSQGDKNLGVKFAADGTLNCYIVSWNYGVAPVNLALKGTWSDVTINNERLIKVMIPPMYKKEWDIDGVPFFVEYNNVVKGGEFLARNVPDFDSGYEFNQAAFNSLAANIDYNYVLITDPGTGGTTDPGTQPETLPSTIPFTANQVDGNTYYFVDFDGTEEAVTFSGGVATLQTAGATQTEMFDYSFANGVISIFFGGLDSSGADHATIELVSDDTDSIQVIFTDFFANGAPVGQPELETWHRTSQGGFPPTIDGAALFGNACSNCHSGNGLSGGAIDLTAASETMIMAQGDHGGVMISSMSTAEIQAIAAALTP